MQCPHCRHSINDDHPECPQCQFHIRDLDADFGEVPPRQGDVVDLAGILAPESVAALQQRAATLRDSTSNDLVVVITRDTTPRQPAEYAFWLFNRWEVGGPDHTGVLVLLALTERRVEVEVGYSLEGIISDAVANAVVSEHGVPFFAAGRFADGLLHACDVLARVLEHTQGDT